MALRIIYKTAFRFPGRQRGQFTTRNYAGTSISSTDSSKEALEKLAPAKSKHHLNSWRKEVDSGRYAGSYDAYILERHNHRRNDSLAAPYISTLRLHKALGSHQYVKIVKNGRGRCCILLSVLVNGSNVGQAAIYMPSGSCKPAELLTMYYDNRKRLLRFMRRDGEHLPEFADIDLVAQARHKSLRPLLQLAHAEGLIRQLPSGDIPSLDFRTNLDSGYYTRATAMPGRTRNRYSSHVIDAPTQPVRRARQFFCFDLRGPKGPYIRFFPYIHANNDLRLWDVDRNGDLELCIRGVKEAKGFPPFVVKERMPWLFDFAQSLGYWKELPPEKLSSLDFQSNLDSGFYCQANLSVARGRYYWPRPSLAGSSGQLRGPPLKPPGLFFSHRGQRKPTIRFFPYVHDDGTLHLWDIDEKDDIEFSLRAVKGVGLPSHIVKKRAPWLFEYAQTLGYWKVSPLEVDELSSLDFQSNLDKGFFAYANRAASGTYHASSLPPLAFKRQMARYSSNRRPFWFRVRGQGKACIRFFPYIPADGNLHLWDVDENQEVNVAVRDVRPGGGIPPFALRRRTPWLFDFAQSLGHWKEDS